METGSYLLAGVESGSQTFYSTAHGSGRTMSRTRARKQFHGRQLQREMEQRGIYVRTVSFRGLAEEAGGAYKDIDAVIDATQKAGISRRVARFVPVGTVPRRPRPTPTSSRSTPSSTVRNGTWTGSNLKP